ncbi:recombinase family protein [Rhizobacter sp. J219]|uniref:recombinase family protein n=1 Tax=Rhizobacter sp. J219 TaxID=2898430 RepID=UPI0021511943|nr:recombinase family protein [Rhizobacter sp. J219]MCR5881547.1 recombinase family protein [Rhizobacter sp. J219]
MPRSAYSYIRFSTKAQIEGTSLARQLKVAREYAEKHKLHLDESSYRDLGISAFKGKNVRDGALGAFLKAVEDGKVARNSILIVENLDRLSRAKPTEALALFINIINSGITIVTASDGDQQTFTADKINNDNGMSLFGAMMVLIRAHGESVRKSKLARDGLRIRLEQGMRHGKAPFWLKPTEDRTGYTIIEDQANIVREVFRMRAESIGASRIAQHLNTKYGWKYGAPQVARLLQNPAVIGTRVSQAGYEPRPDHYTPIISKAEFYDVQRLMSANIGTKRGKRSDDEPNLFTGLLYCSLCGTRTRFFRANKYVSQRYLRCEAALSHRCTARNVNYDAFEKEVIGFLLLDQDEDFVSILDKKPSRKAVSSAELQSLKDQQERLIDLAADGLMNTRMVTEKLNAIEMQIKHLQTVEEPEPEERMFAEKAWALAERHENALLGDDPQELHAVRRELKAAFARSIERLTVHPEQRVGDEHLCRFGVRFRGYEGEVIREYTRPALIRVKGVWNQGRQGREVRPR